MAIFDDVLRGIIPVESNEALTQLGKVLGTKLIIGAADPNTPVLSYISASLLPIWVGLLFCILAYIGISGVVRSAQDGQFLGKEWSSFKVPMGFIVGIILLAPIPNYNGVVVAQYAFAKTVVFGSNLADFTLKKVFEAYTLRQTEKKFGVKDQHIAQVNNQMKRALSQYYCAQQLSAMGYGSRVDFYVQLKNVCGTFLENSQLFQKYYLSTDDNHLTGVDNKINDLYSQYGGQGVPLHNQAFVNQMNNTVRATVDQGNNGSDPYAKEVSCYFESFDRFLSKPVPSDVASKFNVPTKSPIDNILSVPKEIALVDLKMNGDAVNAMWTKALDYSYNCVRGSVARDAVDEVMVQSSPDQTPWRRGWVHAAQSIKDDLNTFALAEKAGQLKLTTTMIQDVNPRQLEKTLQDRQNQELLTKNLVQLNNLLYGTENKVDAAASTYGSLLNAGTGPVVDRTMTALVGAGFVATSPQTAYNQVKTEIAAAQNMMQRENLTQKNQRFLKFMSSFLGSSVTASARIFEASYTKVMGAFFSKASKLLTMARSGDGAISSIMSGLGPLGKFAKGVYDLGKAALTPDPMTVELMGYLLILMNVIILAPELILLIVMLLWLVRVTILFLIIPLAVVIIAIPNTRAGHDIWKSCLATALVPFLALCFYLISYVLTDVLYMSVFVWVFDPIAKDGFSTSTIINTFMAVLSGEIFFRIVAGCLVAVGGSMLLWLMILRGPDYVSRLLHLNGTSGDLGGELEQEFSGMRGGLSRHIRPGH